MMVRPGCNESRPVAEVRPDSWAKREAPKDDDTVTLTKSQFQQILQVIGQVNVVDGDEKLFNYQENPEFETSNDSSENRIHTSASAVASKTILNNEDCDQKSPIRIAKPNVPCPLDVVISCPASHLSWSPPQTEQIHSPIKLSPLSKLEQKRLQWQKEKAEMIDWNPWGKPGAGAPPKKTQIVAPITPRNNNQLLMVQTSGAMPFTVPTAMSSCIPSPSHRILTNNLEQLHLNKNISNYTSIAQTVKPVPPVFRSSIAFGNADSESISSDFYKRQQWLQELEYQREEQRRMLEQMQTSQLAPDSSAWGGSKDEVESISISVDGSILPGAADYHKRNYVRGQGFQLDPVSAALAEQRRQKAQEYQQAIRLQMQEKESRMQAERQRKQLEEEAEERRLQAERARIQAEYEEEQLRIKQKAELEEKKQQALISAVQQARAQAEIEKKTRKIQKLVPLQTDNFESQLLCPKSCEDSLSTLSSNVESKLKIEDSNQCSSSVVKYSSSMKNILKSDCKKDSEVQTVPVSDQEKSSSNYVVDRVLTPSIFRVRAKGGGGGHGREFGTQTDIHYGKYSTEDAESTESNTSSFHNPLGKRIVRVQHSKPYKVQRRLQCNENLHPSERPKWGVNQPSKSYVRMTERDPHFTKRKRLQEIRKQHWAQELAAQRANQTSRRLITNSYPSLRARKAASSSDCTLGYSSSEFETRSCHHLRSNSTPRYQQTSGFRSDCGSAETIAYFNYSPSVYHSQASKPILCRRDSHSSDNLPSIIGGSEPSPSHHFHSLSRGNSSLPLMRRKWHSQETFYPSSNLHSFSPPHVPGVHPRILNDSYHYELPPPLVPPRRKWSDQESFDLESVVRSKAAEGSRTSSAESSEKSRCASSSVGSSREKSASNQNPLVCPEVVTGRPTPRQDRILQNLSSLRQGLMKKQKELESLIRRPPPYLS